MRRAIVGVFLVAFCLSGLACQQNPNAGATAPVPPGEAAGTPSKGCLSASDWAGRQAGIIDLACQRVEFRTANEEKITVGCPSDLDLWWALASMLDPRWRSFVVGHLRNEPTPQGRPISYWQETLRQEDPAMAARGIDALAHAGAEAVPTLISSLGDPNPLARERASEALAKMGSTSVPALIDALSHEDPYVRVGAARGLLYLGPAGKDAIPSLIQALNDEQIICAKNGSRRSGPHE